MRALAANVHVSSFVGRECLAQYSPGDVVPMLTGLKAPDVGFVGLYEWCGCGPIICSPLALANAQMNKL